MRFSPSDDPAPEKPAGLRLCSEEEVVQLVESFYARVQRDPLLAPVFEAYVRDWTWHKAHLVAFWSAMLRGTRRFHGAPVSRHMELPGLSEPLFVRWMQLFRQSTAECGNPHLQAEADEAALRMANHFWQRYQQQQRPGREPEPLDMD